MLCGTYRHTMDPKKRLFIPAKLREELGETLVLVKSVDSCINVYSVLEWEKQLQKLDELPVTSGRKIRRFLLSSVEQVCCDTQGRILIPTHLSDYAQLGTSDQEHPDFKRDAVIIGAGKYLEIWNADLWDSLNSDEGMAEAMEELGI